MPMSSNIVHLSIMCQDVRTQKTFCSLFSHKYFCLVPHTHTHTHTCAHVQTNKQKCNNVCDIFNQPNAPDMLCMQDIRSVEVDHFDLRLLVLVLLFLLFLFLFLVLRIVKHLVPIQIARIAACSIFTAILILLI